MGFGKLSVAEQVDPLYYFPVIQQQLMLRVTYYDGGNTKRGTEDATSDSS